MAGFGEGIAPFVEVGAGVHPTVDLKAATELLGRGEDRNSVITSTSDLLGWQSLRHTHGLTDPAPVPCDVFLWALGPAPNPRMTKFGGVPWLPRDVAWPAENGVPADFLCQFHFGDSRDLIGPTPGDVLLVFAPDHDAMIDTERLLYVWSNNEDKVIDADAVPPRSGSFAHDFEAWGARVRAVDLPGAEDAAFELRGSLLFMLPRLHATKIGGTPFHAQDSYDERPWEYLCQLTSISPTFDCDWPWLNSRSPRTRSDPTLDIGDEGQLTFYLDADGGVRAEFDCF